MPLDQDGHQQAGRRTQSEDGLVLASQQLMRWQHVSAQVSIRRPTRMAHQTLAILLGDEDPSSP
jgi:hypothetical protein